MKIREVLSKEEINEFVKPSNLRGFWEVGATWGLVSGSFLLVGFWPNFLTVLIALVVLGGRHLALAILMHDASHYSLFKSKKLNDWIGLWFCSYPTWQDLRRYRRHHLLHHQYAGSEKDPDISLIQGFPLSKKALSRKFIRDLTGVTGLRRVLGLLLMDFGFIEYTVAAETKKVPQEGRTFLNYLAIGVKNLHGVIITNGILFLILSYFNKPELYLLWVTSYLTFFSFFVRIRSIAEHACTVMDLDPLKSTRTTYAGMLARLTVAPHHVNYHLEHHLLMVIPSFKLKKLHKILLERGALVGAHLAKGYIQLLKLVTS